MVSANSHGHVHVLLLAILQPAEPLNLLDDGLEDVGIIVGVLVLQHAHQSLKAHAGVYHVHGQRLQRAVGLAVVLHEHDVPYLDHLGIVLVHHFPAGNLGFLLGSTGIHVYLRAGTAGTRVTHLPEVVMLVAVDDMVLWHVLGPVLGGLVITGKPFFGRAFEYGDVQVLGVQAQHVHQVFPRHVYGSLLEIVAEAPVSEHLEHGMVIGVMPHLLQVVVLSAHSQAFL